MKHTKEPWAQFEGDKRAIVEAGIPMLSLLSIDEDGLGIFFEGGDARRVVACVNACNGIETVELEFGNPAFITVFNERTYLRRQRDELLAALDRIMALPEKHPQDPIACVNETQIIAECAIASVKGGAA